MPVPQFLSFSSIPPSLTASRPGSPCKMREGLSGRNIDSGCNTVVLITGLVPVGSWTAGIQAMESSNRPGCQPCNACRMWHLKDISKLRVRCLPTQHAGDVDSIVNAVRGPIRSDFGGHGTSSGFHRAQAEWSCLHRSSSERTWSATKVRLDTLTVNKEAGSKHRFHVV